MLIPDIILLLILFVVSIIMLGALYNQYMTKRKNDKLFSEPIKYLTEEKIKDLRGLLPERDNSLFVAYLRDLLTSPVSVEYSDYLLNGFENKAERDLTLLRLISKIGPMLGLMGTLIAMSPALVGLSQGDITGMAYNMQVVFATTVVGLIIALVGIFTLAMKQRWYASELNRLELVAAILEKKDGL